MESGAAGNQLPNILSNKNANRSCPARKQRSPAVTPLQIHPQDHEYTFTMSSLSSSTKPEQQSSFGSDYERLFQQFSHDVSQVIKDSSNSLAVGERIMPSTGFKLFDAMNAIVLSDRAMDIGCKDIPRRDSSVEVFRHIKRIKRKPETGQCACDDKACEISHTMLGILQVLATYMECHTMPQTIGACLFLTEIHVLKEMCQFDIRKVDELTFVKEYPYIRQLYVFCKLALASISMYRKIIQDQRIHEEEDIIPWTFGMDNILEPMTLEHVAELMELMEETDPNKTADVSEYVMIIDSVLEFMESWCILLLDIVNHERSVFDYEARKAFQIKLHTSKVILDFIEDKVRECPASFDFEVQEAAGFDVKIHLHLMGGSPPRTAPIWSLRKSLQVFDRVLRSIEDLMHLVDQIEEAPEQNGQLGPVSWDDFNLILASFARDHHRPHILVRSILRDGLMSRSRFFGIPRLSIEHLVLSECQWLLFCKVIPDVQPPLYLQHLVRSLAGYLILTCYSVGRQRRRVLNFLKEFDSTVAAISRGANQGFISKLSDQGSRLLGFSSDSVYSQSVSPSWSGESHKILTIIMNHTRAYCDIFVRKLVLRLIEKYLVLGFEGSLYGIPEYLGVYFNLVQIKASLVDLDNTTFQQNENLKQEHFPYHYVQSSLDPILTSSPADTSALHELLNQVHLYMYQAMFLMLCFFRDLKWIPIQAYSEIASEKSWYSLRFYPATLRGRSQFIPICSVSYDDFQRMQDSVRGKALGSSSPRTFTFAERHLHIIEQLKLARRVMDRLTPQEENGKMVSSQASTNPTLSCISREVANCVACCDHNTQAMEELAPTIRQVAEGSTLCDSPQIDISFSDHVHFITIQLQAHRS